MVARLETIHEDLEVNTALAVLAVVLDVLRPGLALDVDQHAGGGAGEVHEQEWREVTRLVGEREVTELDALLWVVLRRGAIIRSTRRL